MYKMILHLLFLIALLYSTVQYPKKKNSRNKGKNQQKTQPTYRVDGTGFKPVSVWEASAHSTRRHPSSPNAIYKIRNTVESLINGHPRDAKKVSVAGTGRSENVKIQSFYGRWENSVCGGGHKKSFSLKLAVTRVR